MWKIVTRNNNDQQQRGQKGMQGASIAGKPRVTRKKTSSLSAQERQRRIAETAYFIAQRRGFQGGNPTQDWLEAEDQVDQELGLR